MTRSRAERAAPRRNPRPRIALPPRQSSGEAQGGAEGRRVQRKYPNFALRRESATRRDGTGTCGLRGPGRPTARGRNRSAPAQHAPGHSPRAGLLALDDRGANRARKRARAPCGPPLPAADTSAAVARPRPQTSITAARPRRIFTAFPSSPAPIRRARRASQPPEGTRTVAKRIQERERRERERLTALLPHRTVGFDWDITYTLSSSR